MRENGQSTRKENLGGLQSADSIMLLGQRSTKIRLLMTNKKMIWKKMKNCSVKFDDSPYLYFNLPNNHVGPFNCVGGRLLRN